MLSELMKAETTNAALNPSSSQTMPAIETLHVDPDKILIECGITTPVLSAHTGSSSSITDESMTPHLSVNSSNNIPGQLKAMLKTFVINSCL
jgi:hypothetical protein